MKVFISWSGAASKAAATALQQAIRDVFNGAEPWMSAEDIKPGQQWFTEIMSTLADTRFAIVCLTSRNLTAPWILFEAGVISGHFGDMKVVPLLFEGQLSDLKDPMARFHGSTFDKPGVRQLFASINESLGEPLSPKALTAAFEAIWTDFESSVRTALALEKPAIDVFLSVPMASFTSDEEYRPFRVEAMKVFTALRDRCGLRVFCALESIESIEQFDTYGVSAREDIEKLEQSANFVLLYPERMATSALFEAGYALARGIPCRFFVKNQHDIKHQLPFLMRKLPEVFSNVSIIDETEWSTFEDIAERLEQCNEAWFRKRLRARFVN